MMARTAVATPFAELNAVLDELVLGAQESLGTNFVGAYLQGSFAVGGADEHSDVDFIVVIEGELSEAEQHALTALQQRLFALTSGRPGSPHSSDGAPASSRRPSSRTAGSCTLSAPEPSARSPKRPNGRSASSTPSGGPSSSRHGPSGPIQQPLAR